MAELLVVGSGASGVHFALTALERGHAVTMLDVGYRRPEPVFPDTSVEELKERLDDPVGYFLGPSAERVVYPGGASSYYGHPPSKAYVFRSPSGTAFAAEAMAPFFTHARGGFAEAWTAGCYPFGPDDLADSPVTYDDLAPFYRAVSRRIGIGGTRDDLEPFMPFDETYLPSLPADPHSAYLLARYTDHRGRLWDRHRFALGRSRVATLSVEHGGRPACTNLGRCLWGCPTGALYAPSVTLAECERHPRFRYRPDLLVTHFAYDTDGRITELWARPVEGGSPAAFQADHYVLAAGALSSSRVVLESVTRQTGQAPRLGGLMDNRQVHLPFLTPGLIGSAPVLAAYQFHHLAFVLGEPDPRMHLHGQITTLKAASVHPITAGMPTDLRSAITLLQSLRAALGIVNLNFPDTRRPGSFVSLEGSAEQRRLVVHYESREGEAAEIRAGMARTRRALRGLGAWSIPGLARVLPMGTSVHYAGTLPMSRTPGRFTVDPDGRSHDFPNLLVVDGSVVPRLPAKNLTFTLMANAMRAASRLA